MLGMHGTRTANYAMDGADLICAVGARFDDRVTGKLEEFAPHAKFIHIDIDPAEISKNVPAHIPIVGDARNVLRKLVAEYRALDADPARLDDWWTQIDALARRAPAALRRQHRQRDQAAVPRAGALRGDRRRGDHRLRRRPAPDVGGPVLPLRPARASGSTRAASARWASACRRRWAPRSGGRDDTVCVIAGDGSIQMNAQELATCVQEEIAVKVFIMNNGYLGMVRQWQELFWDHRYSQVDMGEHPDFVKLAEAYGATGLRFTDKRSLVDDMRAAIATPGTVVVDVRVTREENTYPMIAPGAAARDMVG